MKKNLLPLFLFCSLSAMAQQEGAFVIRGTMQIDSLRYTPQTVKKVYLTHEVNGQEVVVDSAVVSDKGFTFTGKAPGVLAPYHISGFDNGAIQLFLEPGDITVLPFNARFPVGARVKGTPTNDLLLAYQEQEDANAQVAKERMEKMMAALPAEVRNNDKAFYPYQRATYYVNSLSHRTSAMQFVDQHLDSPLSLYIIKYDLFRFFTPKVLEEQYLKAVPSAVRKHPMYRELVNLVRAANLQVGKPAPDIEGLTPDGKNLSLSDLRGKYVLIDFWASWCAPCRREFPVIKQVLEEMQGKVPFAVLSYSIDSKKQEWTDCIQRNGLVHADWLHISTLKGWGSPAAKLYNVEAVPRTVLISPEGQIVAFDLRGEQLISTMRKIENGEMKSQKAAPSSTASASTAGQQGKPSADRQAEQADPALYRQYVAIDRACEEQIEAALSQLRNTKGSAYLNTLDGKTDVESLRCAAEIRRTAMRLKLLLENNASPLMPLLMERDLLPLFNKEYGRQLAASVAPQIQSHPYARSLDNSVKSLNLMQGNDVPDITLPLSDKTQTQLYNCLGKYVLLTFWASSCPDCRREMPKLKQLYTDSRQSKEKFVMVSFSLDKDEKAWRKALKEMGINRADWLQAGDFQGAASPAARLFGVHEVPMNILIDPEGKAISFTLRGDELLSRVRQILSGDLYYQKEAPRK